MSEEEPGRTNRDIFALVEEWLSELVVKTKHLSRLNEETHYLQGIHDKVNDVAHVSHTPVLKELEEEGTWLPHDGWVTMVRALGNRVRAMRVERTTVIVEIRRLATVLMAALSEIGIKVDPLRHAIVGKPNDIPTLFFECIADLQCLVDVERSSRDLHSSGTFGPNPLSGHWRSNEPSSLKRNRRNSRDRLTTKQKEALDLYSRHAGNVVRCAQELGIERQSFIDRWEGAQKKLSRFAPQRGIKTVRLPTDRRGQSAIVDHKAVDPSDAAGD